jgi:hypothetical protein
MNSKVKFVLNAVFILGSLGIITGGTLYVQRLDNAKNQLEIELVQAKDDLKKQQAVTPKTPEQLKAEGKTLHDATAMVVQLQNEYKKAEGDSRKKITEELATYFGDDDVTIGSQPWLLVNPADEHQPSNWYVASDNRDGNLDRHVLFATKDTKTDKIIAYVKAEYNPNTGKFEKVERFITKFGAEYGDDEKDDPSHQH